VVPVLGVKRLQEPGPGRRADRVGLLQGSQEFGQRLSRHVRRIRIGQESHYRLQHV
jgi:hypothetical protein